MALHGQHGIELLEPRTLLTTLTAAPGAGPQQFTYLDEGLAPVVISYNDVTFEAVGVDQFGDVGNLAQAPPIGTDLYRIYVTSSHSDSFITVADINAAGHLIPFSGSVSGLLETSVTGTPHTVSMPGGTGAVLIGGVTTGVATFITSTPLTQSVGLMPAPDSGELTPGIEVLPRDPATDLQNDFGNLLIGGTVTGTVSFGGNVNEFYAGGILTGQTAGGVLAAGPTSGIDNTPNFTVAGDLRELITTGTVGTDDAESPTAPTYATDFNLSVGGKLGEIHIGNLENGNTAENLFGTIEVHNDKGISDQDPVTATASNPFPVLGNFLPQIEDEVVTQDFPGDSFFTGGLDLRNDTGIVAPAQNASDAQVLGANPVDDEVTGLPSKNADGANIYQASVEGVTQGSLTGTSQDLTDFYAVPMLAGVTFQVTNVGGTSLDVFDPDGRLIASNAESGQGPLSITPDRPGLYRFEVIGTAGVDTQYTLTVTNAGNMAIGGVIVDGGYSDLGFDGGIIADYGDVGAVDVTGTYASTTTGPTPPLNPSVPASAPSSITVAAGDLRAVIGGALGVISAGLVESDGPYLNVPFGNVGLIQSTTGVLNVNTQFDIGYLELASPEFKTNTLYATAIGGSIQIISCATTFEGEIGVDKGIGTIRAGDFATNDPSFIEVNADNTGEDGIIDLVDCLGSFGTLAAGGPGFMTNDGGQIRFLQLGGAVFRPEFFGGGTDEPITYDAGATAQISTDAGDILTASPIGAVVTNTTTPASTSTNTTSTTTTTGAQLTILTYPVIDKGGQVPVSITSTGGLNLTASGTAGNLSQVPIADITIEGTGRAIAPTTTTDQFGNLQIAQAAAPTSIATTTTTTNADGSTTTSITSGDATDLSLIIGGSATVDVLNTTCTGSAVIIANNTPGDLASLTTAGVGQLIVHGNIGIARNVATAAAVLPQAVIAGGNTYPFVLQHTGVIVNGDAVDVDVYGGVGNLQVTGTLQTLIANYAISTKVKGASPTPGQFDGLYGPVVVGRLLNVDVGQGILPTGSGSVGFAGIYATGMIGVVENVNNPNGDIRGNIISSDVDINNVGIDAIILNNASIIDNLIGTIVGTNYASTDKLIDLFVSPEINATGFANPYVYEIGQITVSGAGGIIGADIECPDVGPIVVNNGGFGVLETTINSQDLGRIAGISASGYGIRDTTVEQDGYLGPVIATGSGALVSVLKYPIDVRESDQGNTNTILDPYFGFAPYANTDLNAALGTTAQYPNEANVTDTGVVEDSVFEGQESFAGLTAQKVRTALPIYNPNNVLPLPDVPNFPVLGTTFAMAISFGAAVGYIHVYQVIDGLQVTTGRLGQFVPGNDVNRLGISVAGRIGNLTIHGNLGQLVEDYRTGLQVPDSYIDAGGPSGTIGNLRIYGSSFANVSATGEIVNMTVLGDVTGSITALSQSTPYGLGTLRVSGGIRDGALDIQGNIGSIIVNGGLGSPTGTLTINGSANLIQIGADRTRRGSALELALDVTGTLRRLAVFGQITGSVTTGGDLGTLTVQGDGTAANIISGKLNIEGRLGTANIINGNISGDVSVEGSIGRFTITRGSLAAGGIVQSQIDSIKSFNIVGGTAYGLFGSLLAPSGLNDSINVSGNIGDGTDAAVVTADSGNTFHVHGSILPDVTITTSFGLNLLQVDGSIATGAIVTAHPLKKIKVAGVNTGTITAT